MRKQDTGLRDLLQQALKQIIADGTYDRVLRRWNVARGSLTTAQNNGGTGATGARPT